MPYPIERKYHPLNINFNLVIEHRVEEAAREPESLVDWRDVRRSETDG